MSVPVPPALTAQNSDWPSDAIPVGTPVVTESTVVVGPFVGAVSDMRMTLFEGAVSVQ
jgi:hypothetical protein